MLRTPLAVALLITKPAPMVVGTREVRLDAPEGGGLGEQGHELPASSCPNVMQGHHGAAAAAPGVSPARAVVFEDSHNGVVAAKEAGMFCVAVPNRITEGLDFSDADLVVTSLADIDLAALLSA